MGDPFLRDASGGVLDDASTQALLDSSAPVTGLAGVSTYSIASSLIWTQTVGTADANYPVTNVSDLISVTNVARLTPAAGAVSLTFTRATAASASFVGVVLGTNSTSYSTGIRLRLFSTNNPDPIANAAHLVFDSLQVGMWPSGALPVANYRPTRPFILPAPVVVQAGLLEFFSLTGTLEIAAVEVGSFWEWAIGENADFGLSTSMQDQPIVGGGADVADTFTPRIANGQIDLLALSASATTALDFQKTTGKKQPFVFVQNYNDPTSWPRWCFLARNSDLPPMVGALYRSDRFQFRLSEHQK